MFGIAMGLILRSGYTTGGTDILAVIIHRRFPAISIGRVLLSLDYVNGFPYEKNYPTLILSTHSISMRSILYPKYLLFQFQQILITYTKAYVIIDY